MLEIILKILFVVFSSIAAGMIGFVSYRIGNKDGLKLKEYEKCVIEELAKIKAELEKLEYDDFDCNLALPAWKVYDIIDKHISELKGEQ